VWNFRTVEARPKQKHVKNSTELLVTLQTCVEWKETPERDFVLGEAGFSLVRDGRYITQCQNLSLSSQARPEMVG
jgi:hypothetical protein